MGGKVKLVWLWLEAIAVISATALLLGVYNRNESAGGLCIPMWLVVLYLQRNRMTSKEAK